MAIKSFKSVYLFIWLCQILVAADGITLSLRDTESLAVVHGLGCSVAYVGSEFPDQGLNQCPWYCKVDS